MNRLGWTLLVVFVAFGILLVSMVRFETTPSAEDTSPQVPQNVEVATKLPGLVPISAEEAERGRADATTASEMAAAALAAFPNPPAMIIPVKGVGRDQLYDSWGDPRGGGARGHNALDIMAPSGTHVIAAAPGKIEKLYFSEGGGGISLYIRSPDRQWSYYYAHLGGYAPGVHEDQQVRSGDLLGYVGDTGNAGPGNHHLHFGLSLMRTGEGWHEGTPVNPYPLLAGARGGS